MKKTLGIIGGSLSSLLFVLPAFAVEQGILGCPDSGAFQGLCGKTIAEIVGKVINFVFVISLLIALVWLIYGGIKWMVSGGDKSAVEEARNHVVAALVGLVIIFLSFFILNFISQFFFGSTLNAITVPSLK